MYFSRVDWCLFQKKKKYFTSRVWMVSLCSFQPVLLSLNFRIFAEMVFSDNMYPKKNNFLLFQSIVFVPQSLFLLCIKCLRSFFFSLLEFISSSLSHRRKWVSFELHVNKRTESTFSGITCIFTCLKKGKCKWFVLNSPLFLCFDWNLLYFILFYW